MTEDDKNVLVYGTIGIITWFAIMFYTISHSNNKPENLEDYLVMAVPATIFSLIWPVTWLILILIFVLRLFI